MDQHTATMRMAWMLASRNCVAARAQRRLDELLALGGIVTGGPKLLRMAPVASPVFYLPDVDPVTRRGTGRVKTARLA